MRPLLDWGPFAQLPGPSFAPDVDVKETEEAFVFQVDVPGLTTKDVEVKVTDHRLTISGEREQARTKRDETFHAYERRYGRFERGFTLPEGADHDQIHADLKDGVLIVRVLKKPGARTRAIPVKTT